MTLINIDYGSLASSETLNKNFLYLEEKIVDTAETINTSISSSFSNIATLNTRISDVSDSIVELSETIATDIDAVKEEMESQLLSYSMVPNWAGCIEISSLNSYKIPSNGFLLLLPITTSNGDLTLNGVTLRFKNCSSGNDYASILTSIPVRKSDTVTCSAGLSNAYFVPVMEGGM